MSTPNINCILQAVLAAQNNLISPPPQIATFDFGNPTFPAAGLIFEPYFQVGTSVIVPSLPASPLYALLVQNLSLTASVNLSVTPNGSSITTVVLGPGTSTVPGDLFFYWSPSKINTGGLTLVELQASANGTPVALIMAG